MAGYRQFHTKFWKDGWIIDMEPLERYLFTYLFTNEQSSISGIFELPLRIIQNETGLDKEFIVKTLYKFQESKKIFYKDNVMWVVKMRQHHQNASPLTMKKVNSDIAWIPECDVKRSYRYYQETGKYSMDTVSIPYQYPYSEYKDKAEEKAETEVIPPPVIFKIYESEVGSLTPMLSDALQDIEKEYSVEWFSEAVCEAKKSTTRISLNYIEAILKRWKADGKNNGHAPKKATKGEWVGEGPDRKFVEAE